MAPWQQGFPLDELRAEAAIFAAHDAGLLYGAFTKVSELSIADAKAKGRYSRSGGAAAIWAQPAQRSAWRDFSGFARCSIEPGDLFIKRLAYDSPDAGAALIEEIAAASGVGGGSLALFGEGRREWLQIFAESEPDQALARSLGFSYVATKIPASSELIALFCRGPAPEVAPAHQAEQHGLARFPFAFDPAAAAAEIASLDASFAQHYSSKNKRASWAALALQGFGPPGEQPDPEFIAKPAEMAKKWKAENPEKLAWACSPTALWEALPECRALAEWALERLGSPGAERIRLMRLAPGGGELARHADITDAEAGVADGRLCRVHLPLVTNPGVVFEQWLLDGSRQEARMAAGEAWALDMRKPHTAVNGGEDPRVHLVLDCWASEPLRAALAGASLR